MRRAALYLIGLGLLLNLCFAGRAVSIPYAGLTIEEHALAPGGEHSLPVAFRALVANPAIRAKRQQWRQLPRTDGVALQFTPEENSLLMHYPVRVGDSVAWVRVNGWDLEVVQDGKVVYTYHHPTSVASPNFLVQGFSAWDGHWVLEVPGEQIIVDGESLNDRLGRAQLFGFRLIAGKPFFFFVQDGKVRLSYDNQVLPLAYEQVPHAGCCDAYGYNPQGSEQMLSFFGLRGGQWYYVDLGVYD